MSRGNTGHKNVRYIEGDALYNEVSVAKLINNTMMNGEKQKAVKIVYKAMELAHKEISIKTPDITAIKVLLTAITNAEPSKITTKRVIKGRSLIIPKDVSAAQKQTHSIKILIKSSRMLRKEKGIMTCEAMAHVIVDAYNNSGKAIEMKKSTEAAAEVNKAYKI